MIYRLCHRYVPGEAEDLAQETFLRAFVERERYDPRYPLAPWLVTLARRLCIDRLRRRKAEPSSHDAAVQARSPMAGAERTAASRQELELVARAMAELAEGQREALWLYHFEGLSYADIASGLGVPIGTVMTWLHRARLRLAAVLAQAHGFDLRSQQEPRQVSL